MTLALLIGGNASATNVDSLLMEGNTAWAAKNIELAEQKYREAIALDPESAPARARLAGLLASNNRNKEAIEAYKEAIMADPENARLFVGIAIVFLHEQSYQSANAMVARALQMDPNMENAQKLSLYIAKKQEVLAEQEAAAQATAQTLDATGMAVAHPGMIPAHPGMPAASPPQEPSLMQAHPLPQPGSSGN